MQRTPYSCAPYGPDQFKKSISPSETMMEEGYIVCTKMYVGAG
jgi:hypothetical protein